MKQGGSELERGSSSGGRDRKGLEITVYVGVVRVCIHLLGNVYICEYTLLLYTQANTHLIWL